MKTLITAEAGINHNGDFKTALDLIKASVETGADLIKFQTYFNTFPDYKWVEFTKEQWKELFHYCLLFDKQWISTPFDAEAVDFLDSLGQRIWKIPSNPAVVKNKQLLRKIAKLKNCQKVSSWISCLWVPPN